MYFVINQPGIWSDFMLSLCLIAMVSGQNPVPVHAPWKFKVQQIDHSLGVGYAVLKADINGDGKDDLVVADKTRLLVYQYPDWQRRVLLEGQTQPDNVCIAAHDIDGDGHLDLALGADWKPFNTATGGTLQWLRNPGTSDGAWSVHAISEEPTLHRIRFVDLQGDGKPELVAVPLMGKGSSQKANWMDGAPLRVLAFQIPAKPKTDRWPVAVLNQSLHVSHNLCPIPVEDDGKAQNLLLASYEGIHLLSADSPARRADFIFKRTLLHAANQENPGASRGASEIRQGSLGQGRPCIGTIEPWHGNQVVVYTKNPAGDWKRKLLDDRLKWGHAVLWADLDGDGRDELVAGVRDSLGKGPDELCGVRIYRAIDAEGSRWERHLLDAGGVAVEDALVADLDGNGLQDIVAVGRATGNARIYWQTR